MQLYDRLLSRTANGGIARNATTFLWVGVLLFVTIRMLVGQTIHHTVFDIFTMAGSEWLRQGEMYEHPQKLYRYSPLATVFFVPWSLLPARAGEILWRYFNAGVYIAGLVAFMRTLLPTLSEEKRWLLHALSLPLVALSINNGQPNVLVIGLMLWALADLHENRGWRPAFFLAGATLIKLWPIAIAGLLVVARPKQLLARFAILLSLGFALPYLFQSPAYVQQTYLKWIHYLASDTRSDFSMVDGYRDGWLLIRLAGIPLTFGQYNLLQAGTGISLAISVFFMARRGRSSSEILRWIAVAGCSWMLVFGPSTESCTYTIFGPIFAWCLATYDGRESHVGKALLLVASLLFVVDLLAVPLPNAKYVEVWGIQPIAVLAIFMRAIMTGAPYRQEEARTNRVAGQITAGVLPQNSVAA